jgi:WD repeat-containing protein 24
MVQGRIIDRILRKGPGDNLPDQGPAYEPRVDGSVLRPTSSQHTSLRIASSINCLDKSPKGNYAVIAGEAVFKTIKIDGSTITEETDLRSAITNQVSSHDNTLAAFNDQLNIRAARWSHSELDTTIVTASGNGIVTLYDLNRIGSGVEIGRIKEHNRQVHKLDINPNKANWLLSASQDGTARMFDIRQATLRSLHTFRCNADAVRDIKWSPKAGFFFACCTASGTVLYWDFRKPTAPVIKISAHNSACLSISWHPDGKHLISGGLDQKCYVWDLSEKAEKRQKPKYTIATPAPVSIVSWRPPCWSSTAKAKRAAQVVVVYDDTNPMKIQNSTVHIWDVARPSLPFKEITDFRTSPTGLLWHERDLLWTVGREGEFTQTDVAFAAKVIDRRSLSTFDFSPSGEVLLLLEERQEAPHPRPHVTSPASTDITSRSINPDGQNPSPTAGQLSISRSDPEEDIIGNFLGPRPRNKKQGQNHITKPANPLSTTPPTASSDIMNLDEAVESTGLYKSQQVMAVGHAPSASRRDTFQYLSGRYLQCMIQDVLKATAAGSSGPSICDRVSAMLEHFAKSTEGVGQFRLAQTWRILSYTIGLLLTRRAEYHRDCRLAWQDEKRLQQEKEEKKAMKDNQRQSEQYLLEELTPRKLERPKSPVEGFANPSMKSILTEEIESTSNMTTPQARPVRDSMIFDTANAAPTSVIDHDRLELTPAAHSFNASPMRIPERPYRDEEPASSVDGYDFYDMDSMTTPAIDIAAPQRRAPLRLDLHLKDPGEYPRIGNLARHDSNESFQMFSTSGDSNSRKYPSSSESGGHASLPQAPSFRSAPDKNSSWDSSGASSNSRRKRSFEYEDAQDPSVAYEHNGSPELSQLPPTVRIQKASPDDSHTFNNDDNNMKNISDVKSAEDGKDRSPEILENDYLPRLSDPSFMPGPIDPHLLVRRAIEFETLTGCLNASIMILLLKPLLTPNTVDDTQSSAILRQFHHRLDSMMLFTEAALLRKLCYPLYPSVYSQGQPKNIGSMGYYCTTCQKPVQEGNLALGQRMQKCYRCNTYFEGCAVCNMREEPPPVMDADSDQAPIPEQGQDSKSSNAVIDPSSHAARLWWWCQGCGHGGHTACMRAWHSSDGTAYSDGCCPLEGCLHPCLPGKWRSDFFAKRNAATNEELGKLVKEGTRGGPKGLRAGGVKRDKTEVSESRAVESVREALVGASAQTGERERRKSVKVVAPGEK